MSWPRKNPITLILATLVVFTLSGCGDTFRMPTEAELADVNKSWTSPEDLTVTVEPAPPADERIFVIDTTASHHFTGQIGDDVVALAQRDETTAICILQIGSDSRATNVAPLCLKPVIQQQCTHQEIKPDGLYFNTKEEGRYREATERIEREMAECEARLEQQREGRRDRQDAEIVRYLRELPRAGMTDLYGAFERIEEVTTCGHGCNRAIWVFSDLKDDPLRERADAVQVNLNGADSTSVHVRLIVQVGEGYEDTRQASWTAKFVAWGVSEENVDWKVFAPGEFAVDAGTTGVISEHRAVPQRQPSTTTRSTTPRTKAHAPAPSTPSGGSSGWKRGH